jgi:tetratricopeptide (TPR) repeat protein
MWSDDRATITTLDAKSAVGGVANSTPSRGRWMAIAGALVLLVAAAFGILNSGFFAPPDLSKNHIAVLPFLSEGGNEDQKVFSDGLTESITNTLTNNEGLSVVPAIDAQKLETPDDAKSRFGATLVLSGSVRRRGEQVRVTINLIDTSAHRQIKSEQIDWPVNKLFDLDQGVLARVAGMLRLSASPQQQEQLAASGSQVAAAQEAFVRGRGYLYRYDKEGNLDSAIQSFETATRLDREFASAYVGLAECHFRKYIQLKQKSFLESSRLSGERALELNPKLASAYVWLGRALAESGQHKDAEAKLLAGVKLDPRDASGFRGLASLYQMENRIADAENAFKQAIAASPGDWTNYSGLASFYSARQRHLDAAAQFRKVIELTPDNPMGYRNLGGLLLQLGNHAEAEVMMKKALDLRPTALAFSNLGALLMMEGRNAEAVPVMESAASLAPAEQPREYRIWGNLGDAYWLSKAPPEKSRAAWKKAVEIAEAQVAAKPPNATLLARIAKYQAKLGNTAEARATIQQAIKLEPSNATVRFQSGIIATLRGDKVRALEELYLAAGLGYPTGEIEKTPELAPLKEEAVFQQLLQQYKAR